MSTTEINRRLAAVLVADVEGYSRLMEIDEIGTLNGLSARRAILDKVIAEYRGRIANTAGDSVLAEFANAVDAVQCAVDAQAALGKANSGARSDQRIEFRVGIHVGDVIDRGGDLFGNSVNIAARLQTLAAPGGVCISGVACEQVRRVLQVEFTDLGSQQVKNIEGAVSAFAIGEPRSRTRSLSSDAVPLTIPEMPSIAVLPFDNMSGDPEQEYFADGMVEDIITALSRFKSLLVIARNSSFIYKGKAVDLRQVGRELGVRYVLEGSVRKVGKRVRITGQLIETTTGVHLWADRFDGPLDDVFELQDKITARVVANIAPKIEVAELERVRRKPIEDSTAYDYFLRGAALVSTRTLAAASEALQFLYRALEREPDFATAYGMATRCFTSIRTFRKLEQNELQEARRLALRSIELGQDDGLALTWSAQCLGLLFHDVQHADHLIDRAVDVNFNLEAAWDIRATVSCWLGNFDAAIVQASQALRLSPLNPDQPQFAFAQARFFLGEYDEAANAARRVLSRKNFIPAYRFLIASLVMDGKLDEARHVVSQVQGVGSDELISDVYAPYRPEDLAKLVAALRRAGMPQ